MTHVHRRTFLQTALILPVAGCTPPTVEVVVKGRPATPTFSCVDNESAGAGRKQFTGLTVCKLHDSKAKEVVIWGVDSDHLLDDLIYGHAPPGVSEFHPPEPLRNRVIYSVTVTNLHTDRSGWRSRR